MRTIHKFKVVPGFYTAMPAGATPLSVGQQGGDVMCWAMVDTDAASTEMLRIAAYGTGHPMLEESGKFIGTVQMDNGLVLHFFNYGVETP